MASKGVPNASYLRDSFLFCPFLHFCSGTDILPADGLDNLADAQRFVAAIQWFLTDLFGSHIRIQTMMYKALRQIRGHLELPLLS